MQEEFFSDTALLGIVSALPGYRFCWLLNEKFDLNFVRHADSDVRIVDAQKRELFFPLYKYRAPLNGNRYRIYKLKHEKESLLPEVRQLDYLWTIQGNTPRQDAAEITALLRHIPEVQLAQPILPDRLKNLAHLIV